MVTWQRKYKQGISLNYWKKHSLRGFFFVWCVMKKAFIYIWIISRTCITWKWGHIHYTIYIWVDTFFNNLSSHISAKKFLETGVAGILNGKTLWLTNKLYVWWLAIIRCSKTLWWLCLLLIMSFAFTLSLNFVMNGKYVTCYKCYNLQYFFLVSRYWSITPIKS